MLWRLARDRIRSLVSELPQHKRLRKQRFAGPLIARQAGERWRSSQ
jgi:hypothetical protein